MEDTTQGLQTRALRRRDYDPSTNTGRQNLRGAFNLTINDVNNEILTRNITASMYYNELFNDFITNEIVVIFENTYIRNYIPSYTNTTAFYEDLKKIYKEGRSITIFKKRGDGGIYSLNFNFRFTNNFTRDYRNIFNSFIKINSEENKIDNDTTAYDIYINIGELIEPNIIEQYFREGNTNCVYKPIIEWAKNKLDEAKTKSTLVRYRALYNNLIKKEKEYRDSGVNEQDLYTMSNKYQINININTPLQKTFIQARSNKKALTTFNLINTKIGHVDNFVNLKAIEIKQPDLNKLGKELTKNNEFFIYKTNCEGYSSISTKDGTFKSLSPYKNAIMEFENTETSLGLCKLDDFVDTNISQFIRQGVHFNETIDMKDEIYLSKIDEEDKLNPKYKNFNHIDMRRAYANYRLCKYYKGFIGKITDFRKCDHIVDIGYYLIKNINFKNADPILKTYNDKMNIYNDNVYPSPELEFLKDKGVSFEIVAGCWGSCIDFEFNEQMLNSKKSFPNDPAWYAKYTGQLFYKNEYEDYYIKGDKQLAEHIKAYETESIINFNDYKQDIKISYKKTHNRHLSHIVGFITAYMRLNVLEQLMIMKPENIIKVVVDGIYYIGDKVDCKNCFREEEKNRITRNTGGRSFISNDKLEINIDYPSFRKHYMNELHIGAGGTGKTHNLLIDEGFIRLLYCAPSWKLSRNKGIEYNVKNDVWSNILTTDPQKIKEYRSKYSVMVIDEVSMMSNESKNRLFKNYPDVKLIFCGDVGFQLPSFENNVKPITNDDFKNIVKYTKNRRCKCPELLKLLKFCRNKINDPNLFNIVKYQLPKITKEELIKFYTINDMLLTRSIVKRDVFTELLKNHNKYYILRTDNKYAKGEILHDKPSEEYKENIDYEKRNAYTIHSIQGETAENMIYINSDYMEPTAIYTALSRAKYLKQIKIII